MNNSNLTQNNLNKTNKNKENNENTNQLPSLSSQQNYQSQMKTTMPGLRDIFLPELTQQNQNQNIHQMIHQQKQIPKSISQNQFDELPLPIQNLVLSSNIQLTNEPKMYNHPQSKMRIEILKYVEKLKQKQPPNQPKIFYLQESFFQHQPLTKEQQMKRDEQKQSTNPNDIYHLTTQCLLIASHYFKSLRDFICLTRVSKRTREIMDILPYNPISINQITSLLFPNIRTLHLYNETDQIIKSPKIKQYVYWPLKTLYEAEEIRNKEKGIEIHFKKIVYTTRDFKEQQQKLEKEKPILEFIKIKPFVTIPNGIREIQPSCFANIKGIKSITVPESVTLIGKGCFDNCSDLREINLPSTIKYLYQNTFEKCPE